MGARKFRNSVYAELCDVLRIKVNAARKAQHDDATRTGRAFKEPMTDVTDTGVRVGDPRAAERRRTLEIEGAHESGTVKIPVKGEKGRAKLTEVAATEDNVRAALDYWRTRTFREPKPDATPDAVDRYRDRLTQQSVMMSELVRRAEAFRQGRAAMAASKTDAALGHRGPTLVRGRAMDADRVTGPRERTGKPVRTSLEGPLGRERADRRITDVPEPAPVLSASQKRRARRNRCRDAYAAAAASKG